MKTICFLLIFLSIYSTKGEAQILKKIKKSVENAVERTVLERTDRLATGGTNAAFDSLETINSGQKKESQASNIFGLFGFGQMQGDTNSSQDSAFMKKFTGMLGGGDLTGIPEEYQFSYRITLRVEAQKDETVLAYWLQPGERIVGNMPLDPKIKGSNITVMDLENRTMVMFMENDGQKMAMRMNTDSQVFDEYLNQESQNQTVSISQKITPIDGKEILGYSCKGYSIDSEEGITKVWITDETPVGFLGGFISGGQMPKTDLEISEKTMFLEMEFLPNKGNKDYFHLVCTDLRKESLVLKKADYSSISF